MRKLVTITQGFEWVYSVGKRVSVIVDNKAVMCTVESINGNKMWVVCD